MKGLVRFGVSLDRDLLGRVDRFIKAHRYVSRSKAIADILREKLVEEEWRGQTEVIGTITMVYDHHQRQLTGRLVCIQHHHGAAVLSSQHIHLDHNHCLEVVIVRGSPVKVRGLADRMKSCKGVKHLSLAMSSTGKRIA
ncbi:MAG: nickel-responsive transcriptional regulator NikR [Candidatus Aureabacteria bacterium]|nr:nickel-responsive transcriptional regulator NikR [Candidatus Auribacterota bacterium]